MGYSSVALAFFDAAIRAAHENPGQVTKGTVHARLSLTHVEIGQLMGICRETITRTLSEFRKQDIVELKSSALVIHNKLALEQLAVSGV